MVMAEGEAEGLHDAAVRLAVAERLDRLLREGDVDRAYVLLLGRHAEPEAEQTRRGQDRRALLHDLVGAAEFLERVVDPLRTEGLSAQDAFGAAPTVDLLNWAADFLPLEAAARNALLQSPTWYAVYDALFNDAMFKTFAETIQPTLSDPAFGKAVSRLHARTRERLIVGGVDEVSPSSITGWAVNVNNVDEPVVLEAYVDGAFAGAAATKTLRLDLLDRFGGEGRLGFELQGVAPPATGAPGRLEIREAISQIPIGVTLLTWRRESEASRLRELAEDVRAVRELAEQLEAKLDAVGGAFGFYLADYEQYRRAYYPDTPHREAALAEAVTGLVRRPLLSVLTQINAANQHDLGSSIQSLCDQAYDEFEMVLLGNLGLPSEQIQIAADLAAAKLGTNVVVADEAMVASGGLKGAYAVFLAAGDRLAPEALYMLAAALQVDPPLRMLYSDEDCFRIQSGGRLRFEKPRLKPGFDPDLEVQSGYLGDMFAIAGPDLATLLREGGSLNPAYRDDLVLRAIDHIPASSVSHLARVLYHRRADAPDPKPRTKAVLERFERLGEAVDISAHTDPLGPKVDGSVRVRRPALLEGKRAAVIIPTRDRLDLIGPCLAGLLAGRSRNRIAYETLVIDNAGRAEASRLFLRSLDAGDGVRLLSYPQAFNWGAINNFAAAQTDADVLIFLNNDTLELTRNWIDELCEQALRSDVGAVGARLLYEDGTIQHAGMVSGTTGGVILHEGVGRPGADPGYLNRHTLLHRTRSVTGACLATRAEIFNRIGGFEEHALVVEASDVDYCLRVQAQGLSVLYDPYATLYHFESRTRGKTGADTGRRAQAQVELARLEARWGEALLHDPFYNSHFDRFSPPFTKLGRPGGD